MCVLDTASCATTDALGIFRVVDLRAGAYRLEVLPPDGLPFTSDPVDVRAGLETSLEIALPTVERLQQAVTVTAPAFQAPAEVKNSGYLIAPRDTAQERCGPAGRVALRAGPARRRDRQQRLPERHHRPRRQSAREPVRGGQRRDSQHQRLRELRLRRRHGEPAGRPTAAGRDVSHGRVSRALRQSHIECAAGDPARRESAGVRRVGHPRLCRRRRDPRGTHQRGQGLVGGVCAAELPGLLHRRCRVWRCAGQLLVQRQGGVRPHAQRSRLGGEHRWRGRHPPRPHRIERPRRGDRQLRHPVRRLAHRHGFQLAADLRNARRGSARRHPFRGQGRTTGEGPRGRWRAATGRPARGHHRDESGGLLRRLARGRDDHQIRPHPARAVARHGSGRWQRQGIPHRLHGRVAVWKRHAVLAGARDRSVHARHEVPLLPGRRVPPGIQAGVLARERDGWRTRGPLRHPVEGDLQPAGRRRGASR